MKDLVSLFIVFARIGGFTFGGGYAMLPLLQKELCDRLGWVTAEELLDYYAIGQCTPGIIAVNTATFVGYKRKGLSGAVAATTGIVFPSLVIIIIIAAFIRNFSDLPVVEHALAGIRAVVGALIINAVIRLWKAGVKDICCIGIFAAVFLLSVILSVSPVWLIAGSAAAGIAYKSLLAGVRK